MEEKREENSVQPSTCRAHWDLPNTGFGEPNRKLLVDLAFRLASMLEPGFAPSRDAHIVSSKLDSGEYGDLFSARVTDLGDSRQGMRITDTVSDPHDGITPYSAAAVIAAYGLPAGYSLQLSGYFIAPMYEKPNPAYLEVTAPSAMVDRISELLSAEYPDAVFS